MVAAPAPAAGDQEVKQDFRLDLAHKVSVASGLAFPLVACSGVAV